MKNALFPPEHLLVAAPTITRHKAQDVSSKKPLG